MKHREMIEECFRQVDERIDILNAKIDTLEEKNKQYDGVKAAMTLSVADRNRLDELTSFYRHMNGVVESIIDRFSTMERVTNKFMKNQSFNNGT